MNEDGSTPVNNWSPEQLRYIHWLALPKAERQPKLHRDLAKEFDVAQETLSRWKHLPGFMDTVNTLAREYVKHDVAEVLGEVRRRARLGELPYVNMVLAMAGMAPDVAAAGRGPALGQPPVREIVIKLHERSVDDQ